MAIEREPVTLGGVSFRTHKTEVRYECGACRSMQVRWREVCPSCKQSFTMTVSRDPAAAVRSSVMLLADFEPSTDDRIFTGFQPWDRVTSGMKHGFTYLLGGQKGVGKSTLTLMLASRIPTPEVSLVSSAEEQTSSVGDRSVRTGVYERELRDRRVYVQQTSCTEDLFGAIDLYRPRFFVVDSMQKFKSRSSSVGGDFGSPSQLKYLADGVRMRADKYRSVALIIGQVRSDGSIAGPNMIQHDVDAVLKATKDSRHPGVVRLVAIKNRGGPTDQWQTMVMTESGLEDPAESEESLGVSVSDQLQQQSKVVPASRFMSKLRAKRDHAAALEREEEFDDGDELVRDIFPIAPNSDDDEEIVDDEL